MLYQSLNGLYTLKNRSVTLKKGFFLVMPNDFFVLPQWEEYLII